MPYTIPIPATQPVEIEPRLLNFQDNQQTLVIIIVTTVS
jgi:hypothetical protein